MPRSTALAALAALAAAAAALAAGPLPAAAQSVILDASGAVNVGFSQATRPAIQVDPNAEPEDVPDSSQTSLFTEVRPAVLVSSGSPRRTWVAGYQLGTTVPLVGDGGVGITHQSSLALAAQTTKHTQLALATSVAHGSTRFLLGQRAADQGQPELRAPGNPGQLTVALTESLSWEVARQLALQQGLVTSLSAPTSALGDYSAAVGATLALEHQRARDQLGLEVRAGIAWLRPLQAGVARYASVSNGASLRWNRDFSWKWNGLASVGAEQVYIDSGSQPLAVLPTATASVRYAVGPRVVAVDASHGSAVNLQVGAVSLTDRVGVRGVYTLSPDPLRVVSFSAGVLHNQPLGESAARVAAGLGTAVQGDGGVTTAIGRAVLLTARYTISYQFGQGANLPATIAHIALVGVTARYSSTSRLERPRALRGRRVDGSDGAFPTGDPPPLALEAPAAR
jgi:hypothetical protein